MLNPPFIKTLDIMIDILNGGDITLNKLIFSAQGVANIPRYFQIIFISFFNLIILDGKTNLNKSAILKKMKNSGPKISVAEGGRWGGEERQFAIDSFTGMIQSQFVKSKNQDPASAVWVTQLENILSQSTTEQSKYDFKQGFVRLDKNLEFDESNFENILKTCVAIANTNKNSVGYIIIGISDKKLTADRIKELFDVTYHTHGGWFITGINHESNKLSNSSENYILGVIDKIRKSKISEDLRNSIIEKIKLVNYFDKSICVMEITSQANVSDYDGLFYHRAGPAVYEIVPAQLPKFIEKYLNS
jgi:hypothetical protein